MNGERRYRAWRFLLPELDVLEEDAGLCLSPTGGIDMIEREASVRQALHLLLSTLPGERVMRPSYGCNLHRLVFAPNDDTTAGLAIHYVRQAIERWEPRVVILHIDADRNPTDPGRMNIFLDYRVRTTRREGHISYPFYFEGGKS